MLSRCPCARAARGGGADTLRRTQGLTLIELTITLAIAALLAGLAYPSFQSAVLKVRRGEALIGLAQLQMAQQRHRSNNTVYATLAQLGLSSSAAGRYRYSEEAPTASSYRVVASAQGEQAADVRCRHLGLRVEGQDTQWVSGPDTSLANDSQDNRRCWSQ